MNLKKKKKLIARALSVGIDRVVLDGSMASEIKEAITRQDMIELKKQGAIKIKEIKGRKKLKKRKTRRKEGKRRKILKGRKEAYVKITRKLRSYLKSKKNGLDKKIYGMIRKKIKNKAFKNLAHFKDYLKELK